MFLVLLYKISKICQRFIHSIPNMFCWILISCWIVLSVNIQPYTTQIQTLKSFPCSICLQSSIQLVNEIDPTHEKLEKKVDNNNLWLKNFNHIHLCANLLRWLNKLNWWCWQFWYESFRWFMIWWVVEYQKIKAKNFLSYRSRLVEWNLFYLKKHFYVIVEIL